MHGYNVVFNRQGVIVWRSFKDENEFSTSLIPDCFKIVEKDISVERCLELVRQAATTSADKYITAVVESSTINGRVNLEILGTKAVIFLEGQKDIVEEIKKLKKLKTGIN